jgi:predicted amidophosphoribosyltransferase
VMDEMFDCCICFEPTDTFAPMCVNWERHTEGACAACVADLKSYNLYCPLCREPLDGHVYPDLDDDDILVAALDENGIMHWIPHPDGAIDEFRNRHQ